MGSIPTPKGHIKFKEADNNWLRLLATAAGLCIVTCLLPHSLVWLNHCLFTFSVHTSIYIFSIITFLCFFFSFPPLHFLFLSCTLTWHTNGKGVMENLLHGRLERVPGRPPHTHSLIGPNWRWMNPGMAESVWLLCIACMCPFVCFCGRIQKKEAMETHTAPPPE